jgi:hypothetical protein
MSGSAHYLEPKFLSELAYEVAALESVSKDLKEADLTKEKLVEEILKEPELSESIKVAISDRVAQADRLEQEIDNLRREIVNFGSISDGGFGESADSFGPSLSVLCYIAPIVLTPCLIVLGALAFFPFDAWTSTEKLEKGLGRRASLGTYHFCLDFLSSLGPIHG